MAVWKPCLEIRSWVILFVFLTVSDDDKIALPLQDGLKRGVTSSVFFFQTMNFSQCNVLSQLGRNILWPMNLDKILVWV